MKNCRAEKANPAHGIASFTTGIVDSVVNIRCEEGFRLKNKQLNSRTCLPTGDWDHNSTDFCERIQCLDPLNLPSGSMFLNGTEPLDPRYETNVTVACRKGFVQTSGGKDVQCTSKGEWNWIYGQISCKPLVTCSDPRTGQNSSGGLVFVKREVFQISSKVRFSCMPGYVMVGAAASNCTEDGSWEPPIPKCRLPTFWVCRVVSEFYSQKLDIPSRNIVAGLIFFNHLLGAKYARSFRFRLCERARWDIGWSSGLKNRPPTGHLRLKNPIWQVKKSSWWTVWRLKAAV